MGAPPALRINATTSAISALSMAMTTSAASNPRACAPGASFPRARFARERLVAADLPVRVAFDLFFAVAMSGQYDSWGRDARLLVEIAMMCAFFKRRHRWRRRRGVG